MVEKLEQFISALTLVMGLCLVWEGCSEMSEACKVPKSPRYSANPAVALVLCGHDGKRKNALVDFIKKSKCYRRPQSRI
jgi:hypothetical protein